MGFYSRVVFPRLCELALDRPLVEERRRRVLSTARGEALEIGFGTGLNLPHYPPGLGRLTVVEPNSGMHRLAQRRIERAPFEVRRSRAGGEELPFEDESFDCVVSTFTLCSIDLVESALTEIRRVLRPGGRFLFLEHGLSPDPRVAKWQRRLNRLEMFLADGCRLNREIRRLVEGQPFAKVECAEEYLPGTPKFLGYLYEGAATRQAGA